MALQNKSKVPVNLYFAPWKATITYFSDDYTCVGLLVEFDKAALICPKCNKKAFVERKILYGLSIPEVFHGVSAKLTAYVPVLARYNVNCSADSAPLTVSNTLLLDVIINLMGDPHLHNPCRYLFNAVAVT